MSAYSLPDRPAAARRAAGAVVFRRSLRGPQLLVIATNELWDFPRGLIDPGEDEMAVARREVLEQTGLSGIAFPFDDASQETLAWAFGEVTRYYLAETREERIELPDSLGDGRPGPDDYQWVGLEDAEDVLPPRLAGVLEWVRRLLKTN
jgi:8-oxo-dGTP pyrophosphatase MutT (NUDIX family)